jgi:hypothetical protein
MSKTKFVVWVALAVDFQALPDGTNDAASKNLDVAAKKIVVNITASNHLKLSKYPGPRFSRGFVARRRRRAWIQGTGPRALSSGKKCR